MLSSTQEEWRLLELALGKQADPDVSRLGQPQVTLPERCASQFARLNEAPLVRRQEEPKSDVVDTTFYRDLECRAKPSWRVGFKLQSLVSFDQRRCTDSTSCSNMIM